MHKGYMMFGVLSLMSVLFMNTTPTKVRSLVRITKPSKGSMSVSNKQLRQIEYMKRWGKR